MTKRIILEPVNIYEWDDPDRIAFIQENAVSLVREKQGIIERQREQITKYENIIESLKGQVRRSVQIMEGLLDDIDRECDCEPIERCPHSRARKWLWGRRFEGTSQRRVRESDLVGLGDEHDFTVEVP